MMETKQQPLALSAENVENPEILEEIVIEELSMDGICGVY
jgi:mycofactocin precursor